MLALMDSREVSGWMVLYQVRREEADYARMQAESDDGEVVISGLHDDDEDDEVETDGTPE